MKNQFEEIDRLAEVNSSLLLGAVKRQAIETERGVLFNLRGLFLQSVGFIFDSQGPGSSRNVLLHFLYKKSN